MGDVSGHPLPEKNMERVGAAENAGLPAAGRHRGGRGMGAGRVAGGSPAPSAGGDAVRGSAVADHGLSASGRLHGRVRRHPVPPGSGDAAAHPEGLPLRGLRGDLHGAAGHGPVERVSVAGGHPPAAAGAAPRGQPGIGGYGGTDAAAHEHQPVQRHGAGRRTGFCGGCAFGGCVRAAGFSVGQPRPAGGGCGIRSGGVVRLPAV